MKPEKNTEPKPWSDRKCLGCGGPVRRRHGAPKWCLSCPTNPQPKETILHKNTQKACAAVMCYECYSGSIAAYNEVEDEWYHGRDESYDVCFASPIWHLPEKIPQQETGK